MADVALLDRVIAGGDAVAPADLKQVRLGVVRSMLTNLDDDTECAFHAAIDRLKAQGVTVVDVEMPELADSTARSVFRSRSTKPMTTWSPISKRTGTGITIEALVEEIASPDVKGTYDGLVLPRKLPGRTTAGRCQADLRRRDQDPRDRRFRRSIATICQQPARRHRLPDHAAGCDRLQSGFEQSREFRAVHPEHRSRQQCRHSRHPDSDRARRDQQTADRAGARRPRGQRPAAACDRRCARYRVRPAAAAALTLS